MMVGDPLQVARWCLRVPAAGGETVRQALIAEGALDRTMKIRRDGGDLLLPLNGFREGAVEEFFEEIPGRPNLPRHELIGGIAVMQDDDADGAAQILTTRPNLHTVLYATSEVEGEYRTKSFAVLAGEPTTRTEVVENGLRVAVGLARAYCSARLATERLRVAQEAGEGEIVLDMFSGVGPFAIALAGRASLVVACDANPEAVLLMGENCRRNRAANVLPVLADARHLDGIVPWQSDRIVMNLPKSGAEFLQEAFCLCKPGGTIHFYALVSKEREHTARIEELGGSIVAERVVRSYSPAQWHAVYDIRKKEREPGKT